MRDSVELQELILEELSHGPYGPYMLAELLGEPPFRIRAELRVLTRDRLVAESRNGNLFNLTAGALARLAGHMSLIGGRP